MMTLEEIMETLSQLGSDRRKKYYMKLGAREPLYGVPTGALKPLAKELKHNQVMAEALYKTGNYDAMYLAGMIADVKIMDKTDFDRWLSSAYTPLIGNFIISVTLSESEFGQTIADQYIKSENTTVKCTGWYCYEWLLGSRKDSEFDVEKIASLLKSVEEQYPLVDPSVQLAMSGFVTAVGISFLPLHQEALITANKINKDAHITILKQVDKNRIGFKRKNVRC